MNGRGEVIVENLPRTPGMGQDTGWDLDGISDHHTRGTTEGSEALPTRQPVPHHCNLSTSLQMPALGPQSHTTPDPYLASTHVKLQRPPVHWVSLTPLLSPGFKETAFLYAISSAGLTHALAKACSAGRMERCTCDEAPDLENREAWQWGGCGDNLKYSSKFVKEFLGRRSSKDLRARVDFHNNLVGVKASRVGAQGRMAGKAGSEGSWAPLSSLGLGTKQTCRGQVRQVGYRNARAGHTGEGVRENG